MPRLQFTATQKIAGSFFLNAAVLTAPEDAEQVAAGIIATFDERVAAFYSE